MNKINKICPCCEGLRTITINDIKMPCQHCCCTGYILINENDDTMEDIYYNALKIHFRLNLETQIELNKLTPLNDKEKCIDAFEEVLKEFRPEKEK